MNATVIYTDGGWRKGFAGAAWMIDEDRFASHAEPLPSSMHAELLAVVLATEATPGPLTIRTDLNTFSAPTAADLVARLRRPRVLRRRPDIAYLVDRFEKAVGEDRTVELKYAPSKGVEAHPKLQVADALERFARQWAVLNGYSTFGASALELNLASADVEGALAAVAGYVDARLDVGEYRLGLSDTNDLLRDRGL